MSDEEETLKELEEKLLEKLKKETGGEFSVGSEESGSNSEEMPTISEEMPPVPIITKVSEEESEEEEKTISSPQLLLKKEKSGIKVSVMNKIMRIEAPKEEVGEMDDTVIVNVPLSKVTRKLSRNVGVRLRRKCGSTMMDMFDSLTRAREAFETGNDEEADEHLTVAVMLAKEAAEACALDEIGSMDRVLTVSSPKDIDRVIHEVNEEVNPHGEEL